MNERKNKPIPFSIDNKRDMKLLDYAENQDIPFASYIKNLIEKDMISNKAKIDKSELKDMIKDILLELNLDNVKLDTDKTNEKDKTEITVSNIQKTSIKGLLKNLNR